MRIPHALRLLQRTPGFAIASVLTLGLGIGISTIVFTAYDAVVLKPIAATSPGELVRITGSQNGGAFDAFSYRQFEQFSAQAQLLSGIVATSAQQTLGAHLPEDAILRVRFVSPNYFQTLGVGPVQGRALTSNDREAAVVSYDFWRTRLKSDPETLGRQIKLQSVTLTVVGIASPSFAGTGLPPQIPDMWIPLAAQAETMPGDDWRRQDAQEVQLIGRRKPRVSNPQVGAQLTALAASWPPVNGKQARIDARTATFFQLDSGEFSSFQAICEVLAVAVAVILLIGSVNLINLLFAAHARRGREFAVRLAMGAARGRLIRQLCAENLVIGALGGVVGLFLSLWGCVAIRAALTSAIESATSGAIGIYLDIDPDWRVFAYAALLAIAAAMTIALWPAIRASRTDLATALKQGASGSAAGHRKIWSLRNLLISAQVAGCLTLLAAAGLLFRGVWRSGSVDPGFETKHLMFAAINAKTAGESPAARTATLRLAIDRIRQLPEVAGAAWINHPPYLGHWSGEFNTSDKRPVRTLANLVSAEYFDTMGIKLVAGRTFTQAEVETHAPVAVIDEAGAEKAWPHQNPIGKTASGFDLGLFASPQETVTIVGVARNVRNTYLSKPDEAYLYGPMPLPDRFLTLMIRTRTQPEAAFHSLTTALEKVNATLPSQTDLITMEQVPLAFQRFMAEGPAWVSAILGSLALLLAAVGIFGLVAQLVAQRTREIAIRVSLGAQNRDVTRLVIGQTMRPVALGAVFGLAGAASASALLSTMLRQPDMPDLTYGAGAFDMVSFLLALGALAVMIALASFGPLRRALGVEPAAALRNE